MTDIRIHIDSQRGKGATTVAVAIARMLKSNGFDVECASHSRPHAEHFAAMVESDRQLDLSQKRSVLIIDTSIITAD